MKKSGKPGASEPAEMAGQGCQKIMLNYYSFYVIFWLREHCCIQVLGGDGDADDSGWDKEAIQVTPKVR